MIEIHGIYDGKVIQPLEPVEAEANTPVIIRFLDPNVSLDLIDEKLIEAGIVFTKPTGEPYSDFEPLEIEGPPLSQTIIEDRQEQF